MASLITVGALKVGIPWFTARPSLSQRRREGGGVVGVAGGGSCRRLHALLLDECRVDSSKAWQWVHSQHGGARGPKDGFVKTHQENVSFLGFSAFGCSSPDVAGAQTASADRNRVVGCEFFPNALQLSIRNARIFQSRDLEHFPCRSGLNEELVRLCSESMR